MMEDKPGGIKKYSKLLGPKLEKYLDNLYLKKCDTLVGIITNN